MKKKIIISIIACLILIIGISGFILWNNRIVSTITLDINPSIEINLNRNDKVKSIVALNDDAKDILNDNYKGKSLDDTFDLLITNLIDKGFIEDNYVDVIVYSNGKLSSEDIGEKVEFIFGKQDIHAEVIVIDSITKEDEELAKKYNISPAKVAYIKSILEKNENINIEDLANKSVSEVKETKETGRYCEEDYILEGDWCLKEKEIVSASIGMVCPSGYLEYNGKCYEEVESIEGDNYICGEEFTLSNDKCIREITDNAIPSKYSCNSGTAKTRLEAGLTTADAGDANDIVCVDTSNATHPMSPCEVNDGTEFTVSGGKCYWHKAPVIESGCPGKIQVDGFCWDDASNILICVGARDGKQYSSRTEFCEGSIKYVNPVVTEYKCENNSFKLTGNKCALEEVEDAGKERICPSGYTLVNNDRCINYNKIASKEDGYYCEGENTRLKGNQCIIYEMIEAKNNL